MTQDESLWRYVALLDQLKVRHLLGPQKLAQPHGLSACFTRQLGLVFVRFLSLRAVRRVHLKIRSSLDAKCTLLPTTCRGISNHLHVLAHYPGLLAGCSLKAAAPAEEQQESHRRRELCLGLPGARHGRASRSGAAGECSSRS